MNLTDDLYIQAQASEALSRFEKASFADIEADLGSEPLAGLTQSADYYDRFEPLDYRRPVLPQVGGVPYDHWESIAYDLALGHAPTEQLCKAYDIDQRQLHELHENPYFKKLLASKKQEVQDVGDNATTVTKFRMIANIGMREFVRRLTSVNTSDKDFHTLFRTALEVGRQLPQPDKSGSVAIEMGTGGNQMTFNIYGMPGLEHLQSATVDEPTQDAEFVEVVEPAPLVEPMATPKALGEPLVEPSKSTYFTDDSPVEEW